MNDVLWFIAVLTVALTLMLAWGFRVLPGESWQILAAMPRRKEEDGQWQGENLTWYGVFNANAYVLALAIYLILMGSVGVGLPVASAVAGAVLALCVPASRWVARIVEKKRYTFTVGGASFVGIVAAPVVVVLVNAGLTALGRPAIPLSPFLAALAIAYAFGEGVGRLACISFGCCYGRRLADCPAFLRRLFGRRAFVFSGKTKKIAYADGLDGQEVLPVQAVTAILYCGAGILGTWFFLEGWHGVAFFLALTVTQVWRVVSETLRADYRGGGRLSAYQIMSLVSVPYGAAVALLAPGHEAMSATVGSGLSLLWSPGVILALQAFWVAIFLYTGRSKVTGSVMSFHVMKDRV